MFWSVLFVSCLTSVTLAQRNQWQGSSVCRTGTCMNIKECPPVLQLLQKAKRDRTLQSQLKDLTCGFDNDQPRVCCPVTNNIEENSREDDVLPSEPNCGVSGNIDFERIEGGSPASLGQWPWMASLGYRNKRGNTGKLSWVCGGALITPSHVLTAAHCLAPPNLVLQRVRLGDLDINDSVKDGATPVERSVQRAIPHERYSKATSSNDIAIIKLDRPVTLTNLIQPICLPKTPALRSQTFESKSPFTAGWGALKYKGPSATHLQYVQFPVVNNTLCDSIFKRHNAQIIRSQICAGVLTGNKDACQGDSGGPLMIPIKGNNFYHIGVVSFGYKCGEVGYPGVYTRTTEYIDWISAKVKL